MKETAFQSAVHVSANPMTWGQKRAIGVCLLIHALDGYDVLAISFAAPGVSSAWGIDRGALGVVLSMELIGMAAGAFLLGGVADRFGRRPALIWGQIGIAISMLLCAAAYDLTTLAACRLLVGLGVGSVIPALASMVTETASEDKRDAAVSMLSVGYSAGGIVGGSLAAAFLSSFGWQVVFLLGGVLAVVSLVLTVVWVPETASFLQKHQRPNRVSGVVDTPIQVVEHAQAVDNRNGRERARRSLLDRDMRGNVIFTPLVYLLHISTFYFPVKWLPKLVADMGYSASEAATVLVWFSVGAFGGGLVIASLAFRLGIRPLTVIALLLSGVFVAILGVVPDNLLLLKWAALVIGFFVSAGVAGTFTIIARAFPTEIRSAGTGLAVGVGRSGAALSPMLAGAMFVAGFPLGQVALVIALGSILAAGFTVLVKPVD